tara:strand:+ start:1098 stop:1487 length:390 start_codon:yes stop_codon:yes gene_type:complete
MKDKQTTKRQTSCEAGTQSQQASRRRLGYRRELAMCKLNKSKHVHQDVQANTINSKGRLLSVISLGFVILLSSACAAPIQNKGVQANAQVKEEKSFRPLPSLSRITFLRTMSEIFYKYGAVENEVLAQR